MPRAKFTALVVAESTSRRQALVSRLRLLGAREVIEAASGAEARVRGFYEGPRDLVIIEGGLSDGPALPLLADLRAAGWRRVVLLTVRDDPYAVRAALGAGIRCYVVTPEEALAPIAPSARPRPRTGAPDELSAREVEVVQLVAEGRSNKDIGESLGLSSLTVKSHLARIARKLGTGDRAEMVAMSMRSGVVN
ncbi:MAG: response regulator transcription factor [Actinomycetes bacterium]